MKNLLPIVFARCRRGIARLARLTSAEPTLDDRQESAAEDPAPQSVRCGTLVVFADGHRIIRRRMTRADYDREVAFGEGAVHIELGGQRQ